MHSQTHSHARAVVCAQCRGRNCFRASERARGCNQAHAHTQAPAIERLANDIERLLMMNKRQIMHEISIWRAQHPILHPCTATSIGIVCVGYVRTLVHCARYMIHHAHVISFMLHDTSSMVMLEIALLPRRCAAHAEHERKPRRRIRMQWTVARSQRSS